MPQRLPDWLIYLGVIGALLGAAILLRFPAAPRHDEAAGRALAGAGGDHPTAASPFESTITVEAPQVSRPGAGTAFSISSGGIWLTARHVVEGCARTAIVVGPGQGVAAEVRIDPRAETAVLITQGGAPALPMAPREPLKHGMAAFHAGFPGGHPGEVASNFLRRQTLVLRGRRTRREQVLAWAETPGDEPIPRSLAGLSGAPALDTEGRVIGVTIAQSRRRAEVYTTTPASLRSALARAHVETAAGAEAAPMTGGSYSRISNLLRRDLRIVPVVCLGS